MMYSCKLHEDQQRNWTVVTDSLMHYCQEIDVVSAITMISRNVTSTHFIAAAINGTLHLKTATYSRSFREEKFQSHLSDYR